MQHPRFDEWLVAEKDASLAERPLYRQMFDAAATGGPGPDEGLVLIARTKRAKARMLFRGAMQEIKSLAESLHHRHVAWSR